MTDQTDKLLVSKEGDIKRITINNPERRNSVDHGMMSLLRDAIGRSADDGTRVVILTGSGDSFCAGADLAARTFEEMARYDVTESLRANINPTILAMRQLAVPIIARVHGAAVGVGCNYALACDLIIASTEAQFGQVFVKIGLAPDGGGTFFLPRLVGYHKAFELMATGEIISADQALKLGMINQIVPFAELDATVDRLAQRLASAPRLSLAKIKAGLNHALQSDLAGALDLEAVNQADCFRSADFVEGVAAFRQKRKAAFGKTASSSE